MKYYKILFSMFILLSSLQVTFCQEIRVGNIYIDRKEVFEKDDMDWFFASNFLNMIHTKTKEYLIEDEILFTEDEVVDVDYIYETERNLRGTGLFTNVKIHLDSVRDDTYNVYITTKDKWSLYPAVKYNKSNSYYYLGGVIDEHNLFGTGTNISAELLHRSENNIGLQGEIKLRQRRLLRTEFSLNAELKANQYKTEQLLSITKQYRTLDTKNSYGLMASNLFGSDFLYSNLDTLKLLPYKERNLKMYYSQSWSRKDKVYASGLIELSDIQRTDDIYHQAFDNCGKILLTFSSVSNTFFTVDRVNSYLTEDLPIGGYGSATLGKIFSMNSEGEDLYYVAGQGESSYYDGSIYLFGQLTGASAFKQSIGKYTYQEFLGLGFYRISNQLLLSARIRQQTVWNWYAWRQLIMDAESGLRGYEANKLIGENRLVSNIELRFFPDWQVWIFNLSGVGFFDIGTVWDQQIPLQKTQFYSSIGAGIRLHFTKSTNPEHIVRIDLAYNLHDGKLGGIIFSTSQMFEAFSKHVYKLPQLFGIDFDKE